MPRKGKPYISQVFFLLCLTAILQPFRCNPVSSQTLARKPGETKRGELKRPDLGKPVRLVLRFPVSGGLTNQHYAQITGFFIGIRLGVDAIVLPCTYMRKVFSDNPAAQEFAPYPASDIYDVDYIAKFAKEKGVEVIIGDLLPLTKMLHTPALPTNASKYQVIELPNIYTKAWEYKKLVQDVQKRLDNHVQSYSTMLSAMGEQGPVPLYLTLTLPPMLGINFQRQPLSSVVADNFRFTKAMYSLARKVVKGVWTESGSSSFNGVHLRVEKDAAGWFNHFGDGFDGYMAAYSKGARALEFGPLPLYIASGSRTRYHLNTTDEASVRVERAEAVMRNFSSGLYHKEDVLTDAELQQLNSEQSALIDLLVLARSERFLGLLASTFSSFIRELRAINGEPRSSSYLLGEENAMKKTQVRRSGSWLYVAGLDRRPKRKSAQPQDDSEGVDEGYDGVDGDDEFAMDQDPEGSNSGSSSASH